MPKTGYLLHLALALVNTIQKVLLVKTELIAY